MMVVVMEVEKTILEETFVLEKHLFVSDGEHIVPSCAEMISVPVWLQRHEHGGDTCNPPSHWQHLQLQLHSERRRLPVGNVWSC